MYLLAPLPYTSHKDELLRYFVAAQHKQPTVPITFFFCPSGEYNAGVYRGDVFRVSGNVSVAPRKRANTHLGTVAGLGAGVTGRWHFSSKLLTASRKGALVLWCRKGQSLLR